jgi:pseudaminic acid synthase
VSFIIAELSGNHGGDLAKCKELIRAAAECGCDAAKIQCYAPEDLDRENVDLYRKLAIPREWYGELFSAADMARIDLFASVFAPWAVEFLEQFKPIAYKIASPGSTRLTRETYLDLAMYIHQTEADLFVSTGLQDMEFMRRLEPQVLFYCKAGYPADVNDGDVKLVRDMGCGFSDHSAGIEWTEKMIRAGATHIEKHFKIDDDCVDAAFSVNPDQMKALCRLAS